MKKILFICSRIPYPPIGGDRAKNYQLLLHLKQHFRITIVALTSEPPSLDAINFLNSIGENHIIKISKLRFLLNLTNSLARLPRPIQSFLYYSPTANKKIKQISGDVDAVFCNLIRTTIYAENLYCPKLCDMADSIGQNYRASYKKTSNRLLSIYYRIESRLLIRYEEYIVQTFDRIFLFNKQEISQFSSPEKITWIPHGVNEDLLKIVRNTRLDGKAIGFFGKMDYQPNIDAVLWFVKNVLIHLPNDIKFYIIGASPTDEIASLSNDRIIVTGFLENPYELLGSLDAMVAPLISGGGIQNKVLEAMAIGQINIISELAAAPMDAIIDGKHAFIARSVNDWIKYIEMSTLLKNSLDYIRKNAKQYIEDNYTWSSTALKYASGINAAIESHRC